MAPVTGNLKRLLIVGAMLAAAVTISAGCREAPPPPGTTNTHGSVDHANDTDFQQKVLDADGRTLVDFYADWCGPCRLIAPILEELAQEEPNVRIVKVNVDDSPELATQYRIESIPALIVFENGQPVSRQLGVVDKAQLRSMLGL